MNEKVVAIAPPKAKKILKVRVEPILPTHIVDVWRLIDKSMSEQMAVYPDLTEESRESTQSQLFNYISSQTFNGLIASVGKRPVGIVLGNVCLRAYGRPSKYSYIETIFVEPSFRRKGICTTLWNEYSFRLKKDGIHHVESAKDEKILASLQGKSLPFPSGLLFSVVGGRL